MINRFRATLVVVVVVGGGSAVQWETVSAGVVALQPGQLRRSVVPWRILRVASNRPELAPIQKFFARCTSP